MLAVSRVMDTNINLRLLAGAKKILLLASFFDTFMLDIQVKVRQSQPTKPNATTPLAFLRRV